jgi:hypothetical protein
MTDRLDFPTPPPKPGPVLWLMGAVLLCGFAYLFQAAYHAFDQIMAPAQAVFGAALIEAGMVMAAVSYARRAHWLALAEVVLSLVISGTYNYIQAERAGQIAGIADQWQLLSLALGPLAALAFLALLTGRTIRDLEKRRSEWEDERQAWTEKQMALERAREARSEKKQRELELEKAKLKIPIGNVPASFRSNGKLPADRPEIFRGLPAAPRWDEVNAEQRAALAGKSGNEVWEIFPGISERTARNWAAWAAEGEGK